jgi:glycosyltransferase involved in cell wall biosynthesis
LFAQANLAVLSGVRLDAEQESHFVDHNINSRELYRFIEERAEDYCFIFLPYLYGTTLKGAAVRSDRSLVMPCFHVEPYVYMAASRRLMTDTRGLLFLTPEEKEAAESIVGKLAPSSVVGGGIETGRRGKGDRFRQKQGITDPYLLYVGRLEWGKNTHLLVSYYRHWKEHSGKDLKLVLVGAGDQISLGDDPTVIRLGTLDDQEKMDACAGAVALCQPSVNESFSRVIMESWLNEVPVMVHGQCPVTVGHCLRSGGGLYFEEYYQFAEVLGLLLGDEDLRRNMGGAGRRYVLENYSWDKVIPVLVRAVEDLTGSVAASREEGRPG